MKVKVRNFTNKVVGDFEITPKLFVSDEMANRTDILNQVVLYQRAKKRAGTRETLETSGVSGSTRKIYNQKGSGRARHGSKKVVQFRGGAVAFGPHNRSFAFSLNKKLRRLALRIALTIKLKDKKFIVLDKMSMKNSKAKECKKFLADFGISSVLLVDNEIDKNLALSFGNIYKSDVLPVVGLNVLDILSHDSICVTERAVEAIAARLLV